MLSGGTNLSTEQRTFLRKSQCGREGNNPLVCCPNTFKIEDLPPNKFCGVQVSDKIVGGSETAINEFPWYKIIEIYHCYNLQCFFVFADAQVW